MIGDVKKYFEMHSDTFEMDFIHIFQIMLLTNILSDAAVPKYDGTDSNVASMGGGFSGGRWRKQITTFSKVIRNIYDLLSQAPG